MKTKILPLLTVLFLSLALAKGQDNRILTFEQAKALADGGDAYGEAVVAFHYSVGWHTEKNPELAARYALSSTQKGHPLGAFRLGAILRSGEGVPKNEDQGLQLQAKSLEGLNNMSGNPYALTALGVALFQGKVINQNREAAAELYKRAADMGFAPAQFNYAMCAEAGHGIPKNKEERNQYIEQASILGYPPAIDAEASFSGPLPDIDLTKHGEKILPFEEALKLAESGDPYGQAVVSFHYLVGWNTLADNEKATYYASLSAKQGHPLGKFRLGDLYRNGAASVPSVGFGIRDEKKGIKLQLDSLRGLESMKNNPYAASALGFTYDKGVIVPRDLHKASSYYKIASDLGFAPAQLNLSNRAREGTGMEKNQALSKALLKKARLSNYPLAFENIEKGDILVPPIRPTRFEKNEGIRTQVQMVPTGSVRSICYSKDGTRLGVAEDNLIWVFDMPSGRLIRRTPVEIKNLGSFAGIVRIYFSKDNKHIYCVISSVDETGDPSTKKHTLFKIDNDGKINNTIHLGDFEIIGFDVSRDLFCLANIKELKFAEMDTVGNLCESRISIPVPEYVRSSGTHLAAFYRESDIYLSIVDIDGAAGDCPVLAGLIEFKQQGKDYLAKFFKPNYENITGKWASEENEAAVKLLELMNIAPGCLLPEDTQADNMPAFFSKNTVQIQGKTLSLEESILLCGDIDLLVNSNNLEHRINASSNGQIQQIIPPKIMYTSQITTDEAGSRIVAVDLNPRGRLYDEDGKIKSTIKSAGLQKDQPQPWFIDIKTFQYRRINTDFSFVWNAVISDDGSKVLVSGSPDFGYSGCFWNDDKKAAFANAGVASFFPDLNSYQKIDNGIIFDIPFGDSEFGYYLYADTASRQTAISILDNRFKNPVFAWEQTIEGVNHGPLVDANDYWKYRARRFNVNDNNLDLEIVLDSTTLPYSTKIFLSNSSGSNSDLLIFGQIVHAAFPLDSKSILLITSEHVSIMDVESRKISHSWFAPEESSLIGGTISSDGKKCFAYDTDGKAYMFPLGNGMDYTNTIQIIGQIDSSPIFLTHDNFYLCQSQGIEGIHFSDGDRTHPFEQFDLRLNRPDIVLERLSAPDEAIAIAKQLREKRLKRMGVTEKMLQPDFHLPEIEILGDLPSSTADSELSLRIKASDSKYPLDRLRVYVNNVPVNGKEGELLRDAKSQTLDRTIPIKLATGRNKIQVSVLNSAGAESLYANAEITCTASRPKPTLYAVAMGVSEYSNPEWNLKYAAKDATDILARIRSQSGSSYGEVKELLLADREVTKENLAKVREFLSPAAVDDTVLMFVAGHGLLDSKYDYYFGTSDIDFENPSGKGIAFEEFDDLLAELPCLRKSLLIDTCHAGELDEDEKKALAAAQSAPTGQQVAMHPVGARGMSIKPIEGARGKSEWYDRLQGLFVDLRRGSGSTILSSSAGAEYALESSEQKNGLFTYAVLEALDGKEGSDANKDGSVTMSELAEYVKFRVATLTNNKQSPNVRRVNLEADFALVQSGNHAASRPQTKANSSTKDAESAESKAELEKAKEAQAAAELKKLQEEIKKLKDQISEQ